MLKYALVESQDPHPNHYRIAFVGDGNQNLTRKSGSFSICSHYPRLYRRNEQEGEYFRRFGRFGSYQREVAEIRSE